MAVLSFLLRPHLALEYSGKATKIHQRTFGNDHPITARSLELMATVYAEIGRTEYSGKQWNYAEEQSKHKSLSTEMLQHRSAA
ncbi:hypothetical protein GOODEAATRI_031183 [Goodea atripinnis]|uniref:Tetratricopeptide repeat protein n=1 Tax=Goodea atripinnis TaxID=208336 RepID=A0ABV0NZ59_9TELE